MQDQSAAGKKEKCSRQSQHGSGDLDCARHPTGSVVKKLESFRDNQAPRYHEADDSVAADIDCRVALGGLQGLKAGDLESNPCKPQEED